MWIVVEKLATIKEKILQNGIESIPNSKKEYIVLLVATHKARKEARNKSGKIKEKNEAIKSGMLAKKLSLMGKLKDHLEELKQLGEKSTIKMNK